jgi:serine/threonine-protein kinase
LEAEPNDPDAWLDERCDDPALRAEVKSLFSAQEGTFLEGESPREWLGGPSGEPDEHGPATPVVRPETGTQIGAYRLVEEIGLGGMSVVYRAERVGADFEQTVAVKLLQRRLLADDAEQRFRAERQVLASLDHPNIAQLIDGGVAEGGRPYLVMELVEGTPITAYADAHDLNLEARLDLLEQVFDAVKAAHRQLVVHRDLKPANVLVTESEDGPQPRTTSSLSVGAQVKLLDFGIAKLLDDALPVTRPETRTGHHLMTPSYAAPEQVTGADVTTGTDVYQLGVLAYELLAGERPFALEDKSLTEIERIVLEETPEKPSVRAESGGSVASVEPGRLRGDLDVIVEKALRKEPERRYGSVETLAADLRRHRRGKPVEARPATLGYRATKFVRRNRTGVAVATTIAVLVAGFIVTLMWQQAQTARQRDRAQVETRKAEAVSSFLVSMFRSTSPTSSRGDTLTAGELLDRGTQRIDDELEEEPVVQARVQAAVGRAQLQLGRPDQARSLLQNALEQQRAMYGDGHPDVARTQHSLGRALLDAKRFGEAEDHFRSALAARRTLYDEPHPDVAASLNQLATVMHYQGRTEAADSLSERWLEQYRALYEGRLEEADSRMARALLNVAQFRLIQGAYDEAETYLRDAATIFRRQAGPESPRLATVQEYLAEVYVSQKKFKAAERASRRSVQIRQEVYGKKHPETADVMTNLAASLEKQHRYDAAGKLFREVLAIDVRRWGEEHVATARERSDLARLLHRKGALDAAQAQYEKTLSVLRQERGVNNLNTLVAMEGLGTVLLDQGRYTEAQALLRRAYEALKGKEGLKASPLRRSVLNHLVRLYEAWGKPEQAERYRIAGAGEQTDK